MCARSTGIFFLFLSMSSMLWAQQRPQYTQYIFNGFLMNPAVAGIERNVDVKLGGRSQWHGLEGAPQTAYLSAHLPIGARHIRDGAVSFGEGGTIRTAGVSATGTVLQNHIMAQGLLYSTIALRSLSVQTHWWPMPITCV